MLLIERQKSDPREIESSDVLSREPLANCQLTWIQNVQDEIEGRLLVRLRSNKEVEILRRQSKKLRELPAR